MKIIEHRTVDFLPNTNITFIRVDIENLSITIKEIITVLSELSWISKFDKSYMRSSFEKRASDTAKYLSHSLKVGKDDSVTSNTGEYVVSELAREAIVKELGYLDIPLAELFKEQVVGNPGFDFYSVNNDEIIVFGEAKYLAKQNAYGSGMKQVAKFIRTKQDVSDMNDIDKFFSEKSLNAADRGEKAYSIAFSSKITSSDRIIKGIKRNKQYTELAKHKELIFVAVNV